MFKETIIYIILTTIILVLSYIFDILLEMSLFIIYYYFIKNLFKKQFHADTITKSARLAVFLCFVITFITQLIFIFILVKFSISYYINIFLGIILSILSYIIEDWLEFNINKYKMLRNESVLLDACKQANLTQIATNRLILRYIKGYSIRTIANIEHVEESTIWQSIRRSRRKLNITSDDL